MRTAPRNTWTAPLVAAGAAAALIPDLYLRRKAPRARTALYATGLITAAAIYPALHSGPAEPAERNREIGAVLATVGVAVLASRKKRGRKLLALGWASHALFDALHERSSTSLLPSWYPAVCAGYDVALAAAIATS